MTVNETIKRLQELSDLGYGDKPIKIYCICETYN